MCIHPLIVGRGLTRSLLAAALCSLAACGVYDVPDDEGGGGGGGGGTPALNANFQIPGEGETVDAETTLRVTGTGIIRVGFQVEGGSTVYDTSEPYEAEFDPMGFYPGPTEIRVFADGFAGKATERTISIIVARPRPPLSEMLADIDTLPQSHWYEIPWSQMRDVEWRRDSTSNIFGGTASIMADASGGAFDTKRNRLVVWGSGGDRNDMYAFDLDTLTWERITDPTQWPLGGEGNALDIVTHASDSSPVVRKSYDSLVYVPEPIDRFVVLGGIVLGSEGNTELIQDRAIYEFDFDTKSWTRTSGLNPVASLGLNSALDADGNIWIHGAQTTSQLVMYDPVDQTTTVGANWDRGDFPTHRASEIDTARNLMIAIGDGATVVWDLANPAEQAEIWATTGAREIEDVGSPGVAYHPASGRIVAWDGGTAVYTLDTGTKIWTKHESTGATDPGASAARGTFGRFRYVPKYDVFVVVNSIVDNVFVYRLPD